MATKRKADLVQVAAASPIEHDGVRYEAGEVIELEAGQAEALIAVGAAQLAPAAPPAPPAS